MTCIEIVEVTPKEGARDRLFELRPQMLAEYRVLYPDVQATLYETERGTWVDIWIWKSREEAEEALGNKDVSSAFTEWQTLVEFGSLTWAEPAPV